MVECLAVSQFRPMSLVLVFLLTLPPWGCGQQRELGVLAGLDPLALLSKIRRSVKNQFLTSAFRQFAGVLDGRVSSLLWLLKQLFTVKAGFILIISILEMLWPPFQFICFTKNWKVKVISIQSCKLLDLCDFSSFTHPQPYSQITDKEAAASMKTVRLAAVKVNHHQNNVFVCVFLYF